MTRRYSPMLRSLTVLLLAFALLLGRPWRAPRRAN